ncbi:MAG: cupin domain-containing protein [Gammaproteobacteria bacterium]|nr:cupin domain-containing protein [Gammaproteobacteria bacterium]
MAGGDLPRDQQASAGTAGAASPRASRARRRRERRQGRPLVRPIRAGHHAVDRGKPAGAAGSGGGGAATGRGCTATGGKQKVSRSRVIRGEAGDWANVQPRRYKHGEEGLARFRDVTRHTLLAGGPESGEAGLGFELRYFEVAPGGYSSLERHAHGHAVVIVKGKGAVRLGEATEPVSALDVVYVAPHDVHRFSADAGEALGFLCVVDRARDRPVVVDEAGSASPGAAGSGERRGR